MCCGSLIHKYVVRPRYDHAVRPVCHVAAAARRAIQAAFRSCLHCARLAGLRQVEMTLETAALVVRDPPVIISRQLVRSRRRLHQRGQPGTRSAPLSAGLLIRVSARSPRPTGNS